MTKFDGFSPIFFISFSFFHVEVHKTKNGAFRFFPFLGALLRDGEAVLFWRHLRKERGLLPKISYIEPCLDVFLYRDYNCLAVLTCMRNLSTLSISKYARVRTIVLELEDDLFV